MKILIIGCGNMGGAMLAGWLGMGIPAADFTVVDPLLAQAPNGVTLLATLPQLGASFDAILLGFKPQQLGEAAAAIAQMTDARTLLISILAGVDLATLRSKFPHAGYIVRAMPNLAAALGKSPVGLAGERDASGFNDQLQLLSAVGSPQWIDEAEMDLVTALVGSGPAFVYRFIDALAAGAADLGLPREHADKLALSMVEGAVMLAAASPHSPGELARRVASPGGVTQIGIDVLDKDACLARLLETTLRAARDRSAEMTEQARAPG